MTAARGAHVLDRGTRADAVPALAALGAPQIRRHEPDALLGLLALYVAALRPLLLVVLVPALVLLPLEVLALDFLEATVDARHLFLVEVLALAGHRAAGTGARAGLGHLVAFLVLAAFDAAGRSQVGVSHALVLVGGIGERQAVVEGEVPPHVRIVGVELLEAVGLVRPIVRFLGLRDVSFHGHMRVWW